MSGTTCVTCDTRGITAKSSSSAGAIASVAGSASAACRSSVAGITTVRLWCPLCGIVDAIDTKPCGSHRISGDVDNLSGQVCHLSFQIKNCRVSLLCHGLSVCQARKGCLCILFQFGNAGLICHQLGGEAGYVLLMFPQRRIQNLTLASAGVAWFFASKRASFVWTSSRCTVCS